MTAALQHLAAARLLACRRAPYLSSGLLAMVPYPAPGLGTCGITARGVVLYDPATVQVWTVAELAGVLVHELAHWMRDHAGRRGDRDPGAWNIACDLSINAELIAGGWDLPAGGLQPPAGSPPQLPEEWYSKPPQRAGGQGKPGPGQPGQGQPGAGPQAPCSGRCGSGAGGEELPGEAEADAAAGRSPAETGLTRRQVAEAIQQHAATHGQGSVPGGWGAWAGEALAPPRIPWAQQLRRHVRRAVAERIGGSDFTWRRASRRQAGIGYGPGRPVLPALRQPLPQVAVVVDTSGSMGTAEITRAVSEIAGVLQAAGAPVTLYSCDAAVHDTIQVRSVGELRRATLHGGGGTDFAPAIEAALAARPRPEVLVYLTDGYGSCPAQPPSGCAVIWCLIGAGRPAMPWGVVVEVEVES